MSICIWAPHPDDEIIGCYMTLCNHSKVHVCFGEIDDGCITSSRFFNFAYGKLDFGSILEEKSAWDIVYAPDPAYEPHPAHQWCGQVAQQLFRQGRIHRLRLYTTTMTAPYIMEMGEDAEAKRLALVRCYSTKANLWKYDWKYYLFEGCVEWRRPG